MSEAALFPFIDPAVQVIVVCAGGFVLLFFCFSLSDAWRARERRVRRTQAPRRADPVSHAQDSTSEREPH
ncbi:hypothetical protein [Solimonas flava]|uniref:hypothetical protein n=1 Tax=Solimonas flava TaxID=415849 RepID=UPI000424FD64|nr:hypothetical protein [Solimonas flava]